MCTRNHPNKMASTEESLVWTPELEVSLFHSMKGHKPVGINRHFHMACIHDKFSTSTGKKNISSKQIWDHLHELYNMQALDELESLPFPNDETEFSLPDEIFDESSRKCQVSNSSESPGTSDEALLKMKLQGLASNPSNVSTPDSSPKRKRTRQVNSASSSQPSSPHPAPSSAKRRR